MATNVQQSLDSFYDALHGDDMNVINATMLALRASMQENKQTSVEITPERLPNNTREGRRTLKAFARKHKVSVTFPKL